MDLPKGLEGMKCHKENIIDGFCKSCPLETLPNNSPSFRSPGQETL